MFLRIRFCALEIIDSRSNEPDSTLETTEGNSEGETIKELYPCLKPSLEDYKGWPSSNAPLAGISKTFV